MAKHNWDKVWAIRSHDVLPQGYVSTNDKSTLVLLYYDKKGCITQWVLPRRDARLLARRILQCLEETK